MENLINFKNEIIRGRHCGVYQVLWIGVVFRVGLVASESSFSGVVEGLTHLPEGSFQLPFPVQTWGDWLARLVAPVSWTLLGDRIPHQLWHCQADSPKTARNVWLPASRETGATGRSTASQETPCRHIKQTKNFKITFRLSLSVIIMIEMELLQHYDIRPVTYRFENHLCWHREGAAPLSLRSQSFQILEREVRSWQLDYYGYVIHNR